MLGTARSLVGGNATMSAVAAALGGRLAAEGLVHTGYFESRGVRDLIISWLEADPKAASGPVAGSEARVGDDASSTHRRLTAPQGEELNSAAASFGVVIAMIPLALGASAALMLSGASRAFHPMDKSIG